MIIPKTYKQFGRTIRVNMQPQGYQTYNGLASPDRSQVILVEGMGREHMEHVFIHESIHMMMSLMQRQELYDDEQFVNVLAGLIHQMLHTGKGSI